MGPSFDGDGLYIIDFGGNFMVKLLQKHPNGTLFVNSVNQEYRSYEIGPNDEIRVQIVGKVLRCVIWSLFLGILKLFERTLKLFWSPLGLVFKNVKKMRENCKIRILSSHFLPQPYMLTNIAQIAICTAFFINLTFLPFIWDLSLLFWQTSDPDFTLNFKSEYLPALAILSIKFLAG